MLSTIRDSILIHRDRKAFIIRDQVYSYHELARYITGIRDILRSFANIRNKIVGVYADDTIETYAAIYAVWFEGLTFLPLNPRFPLARNQEILRQTGTGTLLFSGENPPALIRDSMENLASVRGVMHDTVDLDFQPVPDETVRYVLFTSGSTGIPKGVPITKKNLDAFIRAFLDHDYSWNSEDRFLQMFDLTFDVSVQCYTVPLLLGACICTVPHDQIKYLSVYKVLERHHITVAVLVPSVVGFLQPYLKKIHLPEMRYTIFTGESVPLSIVEEWAQCCPGSLIDDCYGPTEATIYCFSYRWDRKKGKIKSCNGIVSIGKPFRGITAQVVDAVNNPVPRGTKGELLISGDQVTKGYTNTEGNNISSFPQMTLKDKVQVFYRTGDLVFEDEEGDFMYCGRIDHQVQVQGHRVELGEIEYHAKTKVHPGNAVAVAKPNPSGNMEIYLFVETIPERIPEVTACLQSALPYYMQPLKTIPVNAIPLNANGKTDRNKLLEMIG
jgi:D-alanine--poly(phosphoribitol) ligase subunit 1